MNAFLQPESRANASVCLFIGHSLSTQSSENQKLPMLRPAGTMMAEQIHMGQKDVVGAE